MLGSFFRTSWRVVTGLASLAVLARVRDPVRRARAASRRSVRRLAKTERRVGRELVRAGARAQRKLDALTASQMADELRERPLESLRRYGATGIRYSALTEAGIESVADLQKLSDAELDRIPGVGGATVQEVRRATRALEDDLRDRIPRPPTADELDDSPNQSAARELLGLADTTEVLGPHAADLALRRGALEVELDEAGRGASLWQWLRHRGTERYLARRDTFDAVRDAAERARLDHETWDTELETVRRTRTKLRKKDFRTEYQERFGEVSAALDLAHRRAAGERAPAPVDSRAPLVPSELLEQIDALPFEPRALNVTLRGYQDFGARFMLCAHSVILGDEMGLGKTMQALAAIAHVEATQSRVHAVVVAPAGLVENWRREIETRTSISAYIARGPERESATDDWREHGGILVTSYATSRSDGIVERIASGPIDFLVCDEAHYLKNRESQRSVATSHLVAGASRVAFMTGTPLENHPREFSTLIESLGLPSPDPESQSERAVRQFREEIAGTYLRRNQVDVLKELPPLLSTDVWVELTSSERNEYRDAVESGAFMAMRRLVTTSASGSSKLDRVAELVEEHREEGHKILIFSFFLEVLSAAADRLGSFGTLSGSVPAPERQEIVDAFSAAGDGELLTCQINAAGHGLNLQAANVVIILEPQLTPTAEAQAIARAHRMGQSRRVVVHRVLAAGTVDESIDERLRKKREYFDDYARGSVVKELDDDAVDGGFVQELLERERARLRE